MYKLCYYHFPCVAKNDCSYTIHLSKFCVFYKWVKIPTRFQLNFLSFFKVCELCVKLNLLDMLPFLLIFFCRLLENCCTHITWIARALSDFLQRHASRKQHRHQQQHQQQQGIWHQTKTAICQINSILENIVIAVGQKKATIYAQ